MISGASQVGLWSMAGRIAAALAAALLAASCAVGPDYRRPEAMTVMPETYAEAGPTWKIAAPRADLSKGPWWEIFGDPELNRLEAEAAEANQEIQAAAARFAQARASIDVVRAGLFPRIGAAFSGLRQQDSENRPMNSTGQAAGKGFTYDNFALPFDASYEVDLWGRVRRQVEGARASGEAAAADLEGVKLAVAAEVAGDYFALRALDAEMKALQANIEAYRKAVELTQNRRTAGLSSDLDVAQAQTVLNSAASQLPALQRTRLQFEHALAVLVGQPASVFHLKAAPLEAVPVTIVAGVPSALLERRPDISAAEHRMAASNAAIGVAKSAFFPVLRLSGQAGFQSIDTGTLLSVPSHFWALGPSLALPLFQGGQRRAGVRSAKARYEEAVATYRQVVLRAIAEVEDNLAAQRLLEEQYDQERAAHRTAKRQLELAETRYRGGLVSYLQVTFAQSAALEHERMVARLRGQRFAAAVALVKALGGKWSETRSLNPEESGPEPVPQTGAP